MRIRRKDGENLTKDNIQRVIRELSSDTPITKKKACGMLNISYNTTRLNKIIEDFNTANEFAMNRRKELRSKPITKDEIAFITREYLDEAPLSDISNTSFRSMAVIKRILAKYNVPLRESSSSYHNPPLLELGSIKDDYVAGDLVFCARYGKPGTISSVVKGGYGVWLHGIRRQHCYQPYHELADLRKLQNDFGIAMQDMENDEVVQLLNESLKRSRKRANG